MKLTQDVIDKIQEAMLHTKMNGDVNWQDGDEIDVCVILLRNEETYFRRLLFYCTHLS